MAQWNEICLVTAAQLESFGQQLLGRMCARMEQVLETHSGSGGLVQQYGTAADLAKIIGVSSRTINRILAGCTQLEYIVTKDYMGRKGEKRYNIQSFITMFRCNGEMEIA